MSRGDMWDLHLSDQLLMVTDDCFKDHKSLFSSLAYVKVYWEMHYDSAFWEKENILAMFQCAEVTAICPSPHKLSK
jgi:hypothetical protein